MGELWMSRYIDIVCLTIQEPIEFGDKLIQLSEGEERAILGSRISERFDILLSPYLGPRRTGCQLRISRLTEEQNARIDGEQGASRGILEVLESLHDRVADTIVKSEVFVALVWLRADLEEKD